VTFLLKETLIEKGLWCF